MRPDVKLSNLVPHASSMILLDEVLDVEGEVLVAGVTITPHSYLYTQAKGVPSYAGIEYMAQAIATWSGWQRHQKGKNALVGLLLGTRRYHCDRPYFCVKETLHVTVEREFLINRLGSFKGTIALKGEVIAHATLTVYEQDEKQAEIV